jgi:4-hydroxybenzoate polyprenyltransferase
VGGSMWRDVAAVHRLDASVLLLAVCIGWWGAFYTAAEPSQLGSVAVWLAAGANVLLFFGGGLALNTCADAQTDARHADKAGLTAAAERVNVRAWCTAEIVAGFGAAVAVSVMTGHVVVAVAATGTVAAHLAYNLGRLRLKHRGILGAIVFGAATGVLPFAVSAGAVVPRLPGWAWWLGAGLSALSAGRTAWWSVPDERADRDAGADTPSVRYGARGATARACMLMVAGLALAVRVLVGQVGPALAVVALFPHAVVLAIAAAPLVRPGAGFLSWRTMYKRVLRVVTLGDLLVLAVPAITLL